VAASTFRRPSSAPTDIGHAAIGTFMPGRTDYGQLAAPVIVGRPRGLGSTPALYGLFRRGRTVGVSQINTMATNIGRG
jgi:hypothetical protein